jgi:hypothetical protein
VSNWVTIVTHKREPTRTTAHDVGSERRLKVKVKEP